MSSPGWYPQPDGSERYYDGQDWTEQVRASQAAGPVPPQMPQEQKKKGGALKWIAIGLGLLLVLCCGGAVLAMGSDDEASSPETSSVSESAETEAAEEPSPEESSTEASSKKADNKEEKQKEKPAEKPAGPDVTVTAGELIKEFEGNELAADQKYKGKTIQVSGVVDKIDTELFNEDKYLLNITDGGDFEFLSVTCHDMSTDVLSTLSAGNPVTVIGDFDDGGDLGVDLKNCKLA